MEAVLKAARDCGRTLVLKAVERAGTAFRSAPGAAGALMLSWGLGQIYGPLLWVSLGLFALAVDRRMP